MKYEDFTTTTKKYTKLKIKIDNGYWNNNHNGHVNAVQRLNKLNATAKLFIIRFNLSSIL